MAKLAFSPETFTRLTKVADERKSTVEILAEQVISRFLELEAQQKMEQEIKAFRAMHPELLIQYPNLDKPEPNREIIEPRRRKERKEKALKLSVLSVFAVNFLARCTRISLEST